MSNYHPISLFESSFQRIFQTTKFSNCVTFDNRLCLRCKFFCMFCYKAIMRMQKEYNYVQDYLETRYISNNFDIYVKDLKYNPHTKFVPKLLFNFKQVELTCTSLNVFQKFVMFHCLFQCSEI